MILQISAYAIREKGGKAERFSYQRALGSRDVLVRITHCSIARGDIQFIDNDWGDTRFPLVPGHEIVGIVEEAGSDVAELQRGDRVGVGYQQEACFECSFCKQGIEQLCPNQKVIAVDRYGGLAEHIVVDSRFAFRLPPQLDSARSTPLLSSGLTVYTGIRRARLADGSRVAVETSGWDWCWRTVCSLRELDPKDLYAAGSRNLIPSAWQRSERTSRTSVCSPPSSASARSRRLPTRASAVASARTSGDGDSRAIAIGSESDASRSASARRRRRCRARASPKR